MGKKSKRIHSEILLRNKKKVTFWEGDGFKKWKSRRKSWNRIVEWVEWWRCEARFKKKNKCWHEVEDVRVKGEAFWNTSRHTHTIWSLWTVQTWTVVGGGRQIQSVRCSLVFFMLQWDAASISMARTEQVVLAGLERLLLRRRRRRWFQLTKRPSPGHRRAANRTLVCSH